MWLIMCIKLRLTEELNDTAVENEPDKGFSHVVYFITESGDLLHGSCVSAVFSRSGK
jgi:hypothetical protein